MPIQVTYPGVYVQEIPGGQATVAGVSTASTAFVDFFARGPMNKPTRITSTQDLDRIFGGLHKLSEATYGLRQYFLNGGQEAWIIRTGDGTARKSSLKVVIKTPGLPYRVQASRESFEAAKKAAEAAKTAADKAAATLANLQTPGITDQEREEGKGTLRASTTDAATATQQAAEATREAAKQAKAASDELALAIAKVAGASGPVADRTAMSAQKAADGANASSDAAGATADITVAALSANSLATAALQAGGSARTAASASGSLQDALTAIQAAEAAAKAATDALDKANSAKDMTGAQQNAGTASAQAAEAAAQAQQAAQKVAQAAQTVLDTLKTSDAAQKEVSDAAADANSDGGKAIADLDTKKKAVADAQKELDTANAALATAQAKTPDKKPTDADAPDELKTAQKAVDDAQTKVTAAQKDLSTAQTAAGLPQLNKTQEQLDNANKAYDKATKAAQAAADADWAVLTSLTPDDAKNAAKAGNDAAQQAKAAASGDAPSAQSVADVLLASVLKLAADAATQAAKLAGKDAGDPQPSNGVAEQAIKALDRAIGAAQKAALAATGAAQDATVAADSVTSGGPALLARAATNSAGKAQKETVAIVKDAKTTKLKVNQANMTAAQSVAPANKAAEAAKAKPADTKSGVATAADTAQKALNAANNALATAESVEEAAVMTSKVSVQASVSADVAAQAAQAAVVANEESNQDPTLIIEAINEGEWGDNLQITLDVLGTDFSLHVSELVMQNGVTRQLAAESYSNLTLDAEAPASRRALELVNHNSNLVRLSQFGPKIDGAYPDTVKGKMLDDGADGGRANADQLVAAMYTLDFIEPSVFNLLCLPATGNMDDAQASVVISEALAYCLKKRAFFIADIPPRIKTVDAMLAWRQSYGNAAAFGMAVYFPRLIIPDPLNDFRPRDVGPSGTMAGIYARTDTRRGVWKAPAGIEAVLMGAEVAVTLNDDLNGQLNPLGVNVLRSFPIYGNVAWGARTLAGADTMSSEYKYINVRRLMNYVEESIFRSMKWAVFEPNNENLWGKIRLQINSFLSSLFAAGAFQGATPAASYFVQCDGKTTTPLDIDLGVVNVIVGIAPVKPAEFIVLQFKQIAGQSAS